MFHKVHRSKAEPRAEHDSRGHRAGLAFHWPDLDEGASMVDVQLEREADYVEGACLLREHFRLDALVDQEVWQ